MYTSQSPHSSCLQFLCRFDYICPVTLSNFFHFSFSIDSLNLLAMTARLIVLGGFLGAGKTTLLAQCAVRLMAQGHRVAVVTNDQAPELVDTAVLQLQLAQLPSQEVSGACFCCAFPDFASKVGTLLQDQAVDVVLAEPVGSCVDLAATVLRPLARAVQAAPAGDRMAQLQLAPFAVLVDPAALRSMQQLPPATAYIYQKQILEADILVLNKSDSETPQALALSQAELAAACPATPLLLTSGKTGAGIDDLLQLLMRGSEIGGAANVGQQRINVDYDLYAEGEVQLGWLNATMVLRRPADSGQTASLSWSTLMEKLTAAVATAGQAVHIKCLLRSGSLSLASNVVTGRPCEIRRLTEGEVGAEGSDSTTADAAATNEAHLLVNARVACAPHILRLALLNAVKDMGVEGQLQTIRAFAPARPVPVHRIE